MVTSTPNPPISVEDFSRIHGVIRGVLAGLEIGASSINKSCVFFAMAVKQLALRVQCAASASTVLEEIHQLAIKYDELMSACDIVQIDDGLTSLRTQ